MSEHSKLQTKSKHQRVHRTKKALTATTLGIDLGDRHSWVCTLDEKGHVVSESRVRTKVEALREYFASLAPARVALEAGTHSGWVSRLAEGCGHEVIVANARELRRISHSDRKNDRSDAQLLARLARVDPQLLSPIRHRSAAMQAHMAHLRARDTLVRARCRLINTTRGLVKATGGRLPPCSTAAFARRVAEHVPEDLQAAVAPLIATIDTIDAQIRTYDRQIDGIARKHYPHTAVLQQITGVGPLTALAFILTLADRNRFARSRDVGSYLGLVPRQRDSGDCSPQLPITKAGNAYMRRLLVGCAHYLLGPFGPDCNLRRHGERLMQRGGKNAKKRAVVAVARKLSVLLHRLWVTGELYEPLHNIAQRPQSAA